MAQIFNENCLTGMERLGSESVDLICTDVPYNTGMKESTFSDKEGSKVRLNGFFNDSYSDSEYKYLVDKSCKEFNRVLKNDRACYVFINYKKLGIWMDSLERNGFVVKNVIVWDKMCHGLNYQNYAYCYELIIFAAKGNFSPNNKTDRMDSELKLFTDMWRFPKHSTFDESHETIKNIELIKAILRHSTMEGELVLDSYMGTGTTAVACKQMKRDWVGFEIEKKFCDVAAKRLSQGVLMI